jgi:hypothetical protein
VRLGKKIAGNEPFLGLEIVNKKKKKKKKKKNAHIPEKNALEWEKKETIKKQRFHIEIYGFFDSMVFEI